MSSVVRKMASGAIWMVFFKILDRLIGVISTLVLARLLLPADFGLVAIATAFYGFLEILGALGLETALIREKHPDRRKYDSAWTINLLFFVLCAITLLMSAAYFARLYEDPRLEVIVQLLALAALFQGLINIGTVDFQKHLDFRKEFIFLFSKRFLPFVIVIVLAFWLRDYRALVIGIVMGRFITLLLSYILHPFRPRFSLTASRDLWSATSWMMIVNWLSYLYEHAPRFFIGKLGGAHHVGVFLLAKDIAQMATQELVAAVNRATLPGYAALDTQPDKFREQMCTTLAVVALVVLPLGLGLCATAPVFVPILLGPQWLDAIVLIQILVLAFTLNSLIGSLSMAIMARSGLYWIALASTIAVFVLFGAAVGWHALGWSIEQAFAIAYLCATIGSWVVYTILLRREFGLRASAISQALLRPLIAAVVMYWGVWAGVASLRTMNFSVYLQLGLEVLAGAVIYTLVILILWQMTGRPQGAERILFGLLAKLTPQR